MVGDDRRLYWIDDDRIHGVFGIHSAALNGTGFQTIIDSGRCVDNLIMISIGFILMWPT